MYSVEGNERIIASEDRSIRLGIGSSALRRYKRSRSLLSASICTFSIFECVRPGYVYSSGNRGGNLNHCTSAQPLPTSLWLIVGESIAGRVENSTVG